MRQDDLLGRVERESPRGTRPGEGYLRRAGFISKVCGGAYDYLPLGARVAANLRDRFARACGSEGYERVELSLLAPPQWWDDPEARERGRAFARNRYRLSSPFLPDRVLRPSSEEAICHLVGRATGGELRRVPLRLWLHTPEVRPEGGGRGFDRSTAYESLLAYRFGIAGDGAAGDELLAVAERFLGEIDLPRRPTAERENEILGSRVCDFEAPIADGAVLRFGQLCHLGSGDPRRAGLRWSGETSEREVPELTCLAFSLTRLVAWLGSALARDGARRWPPAVAPFLVHLVSLGPPEAGGHRVGRRLYDRLHRAGVDVLWDDRDHPDGQKLAERDVLRMPVALVASPESEGSDRVSLRLPGEPETAVTAAEAVARVVALAFPGSGPCGGGW